MRILITGICGFAGSTLARRLLETRTGLRVFGIDNLSRAGSQSNLEPLRKLGCEIQVADLRDRELLSRHAAVDWLIDAAANPSVLAGVSGTSSAEDLLETNLFSTVPMLEFCRRHGAAFTLISTSRVYSIQSLRSIPLEVHQDAFRPKNSHPGAPLHGIDEAFSTTPPLSLYGSSKRCAELLALEYGDSFGFPVWINRCGVLAGAGQFGKADQGIFSFWIHRWSARRPLRTIGFGGHGWQVRDCLHPQDLVPLLLRQADAGMAPDKPRVLNLSGGISSATSLTQLSHWCTERLGPHPVEASLEERPFDLPWVVLNPSLAQSSWEWTPTTSAGEIFEEIAVHASQNPHWLEMCEA